MKNIVYFKENADSNIVLLTTLYITSLLANLAVGYRYISLGSLAQSGGIFIFPISFIISDIITEVYGSRFSKKIVYYGITSQIIFAIYAYIIVHLPAPYYLLNQQSYYHVFNQYINFAVASTVSIYLGSWINIFLLSKFSEYVGGKYFAMRSFLSSSVGELVVTIISMLIANYGKLDQHVLIYMIACCFLMKTIVSFIAIWPASIVVYFLQNKNKDISILSNSKSPTLSLKKLIKAAWSSKGYMYTLELINLTTGKAVIFFKGTRGTIIIPLKKIVMNNEIISKTSPADASHIGFYYGFLIRTLNDKYALLDNVLMKKSFLYLKNGKYNIESISRDGMLNIRNSENNALISRLPNEVYRNDSLVNKFDATQALYIGYLAGKSLKHEKTSSKTQDIIKLTLVT